MRRLLLATAGLATAAFLTGACYVLVDALAIEDKSSSQTFAAVDTVRLDVDGGGKVRVVGDGGDEIRVDLEWREGLRRPEVTARIEGDRLVVRTRCPEIVNAFCTVRGTIHVPTGTTVDGGGSSPIDVIDVAGRVRLDVDNGSVRVEGAQGAVEVHGDNGSITVADGAGPLDLRTDNGSIRTERVRADRITAETDNGRVELGLAASPEAVEATTDNGSVTVLVPTGSGPYAVSTATDNGNVENLVDTSPSAGRTIVARTDNGSISLRYAG